MFKDYLEQCHKESNYLEAKRVKEKLNQLSIIEYNRQIRSMEQAQQLELIHVEQIQRQQFQEFTDAWDSYMGEYEHNAFQSVERMKTDQNDEVNEFRQTFLQRVSNRYQLSRKIIDVKTMERKAFSSKLYEQAEQHSQVAEQMEINERQQHYQKILVQMEKEEERLKIKMTGFMNTLLKRIQRDRDEQLAHRK